MRLLSIALLAAVIFPSSASATSVFYEFEAAVDSVSTGTPVAIGDMVFGSFSYDTDLSGCGLTGAETAIIRFCNPGHETTTPWVAGFTTGVLSVTFDSRVLEGGPLAEPGFVEHHFETQIQFGRFGGEENGTGVDEFSYWANIDSVTDDGRFQETIRFSLLADNDDVWGTLDEGYLIPSDIDLSDFVYRQFSYSDESTGYGFSATVNSLSLIPEPSTASLLALGLVGIAAKRRRSN
jgi:hypothetical protein